MEKEGLEGLMEFEPGVRPAPPQVAPVWVANVRLRRGNSEFRRVTIFRLMMQRALQYKHGSD